MGIFHAFPISVLNFKITHLAWANFRFFKYLLRKLMKLANLLMRVYATISYVPLQAVGPELSEAVEGETEAAAAAGLDRY